uniref:Ig-like domain-containing protein n=1 Tax=Anguilla anguilla TaxID=7936 RepID=A0A0E9X745_ANGAN
MKDTACIMVLLCVPFYTYCGGSECPLELNPPSIVVKYGDPVSVNCTVTAEAYGIGWEASEGGTGIVEGVKSVIWKVENLTDYETRPRCFGNFNSRQCNEPLDVVLYHYPDQVSIWAQDHQSPMIEWTEYRLVCNVSNVAPINLLTLKWYKGHVEVQNVTFNDTRKTLASELSVLPITPTRADDGAEYRCDAVLDLGPEGPQPPVAVYSKPFNITVHYSPNIIQNQSHGTEEGGDALFNCTATGNPVPTIEWKYKPADNVRINTSGAVSLLTISAVTADQDRTFTCVATNSQGGMSVDFLLAVKAKSTGAGMVVGVIIAVVLLALFIGLGVVFYRRRR